MAATADYSRDGFKFPISELFTPAMKVEVVPETMTVDEVSELMENRPTSFVAVVDSAGKYRDAVTAFDLCARARAGKDMVPGSTADIGAKANAFGERTVGDIIGSYALSGTNPEWRLSPAATVRSTFFEFAAGMHYRLVCEPGDELNGHVLEKKHILRWALANKTFIGRDEELNNDINSAGLLSSSFLRINEEMLAGQAFDLLFEDKVDGAAIVDAKGRLLGNFSVSDVRGLSSRSFADLLRPIGDFLRSRGRLRYPVTCTLQSTVMQVNELIVDHGVTRVWVVDPATLRLIGVCSAAKLLLVYQNMSA
eukprot:Amastigsp_a341175_52.p1 type:complete len:309 gc:universal Amastigsp_a341175_52:31-957(+)